MVYHTFFPFSRHFVSLTNGFCMVLRPQKFQTFGHARAEVQALLALGQANALDVGTCRLLLQQLEVPSCWEVKTMQPQPDSWWYIYVSMYIYIYMYTHTHISIWAKTQKVHAETECICIYVFPVDWSERFLFQAQTDNIKCGAQGDANWNQFGCWFSAGPEWVLRPQRPRGAVWFSRWTL